MQCDVVFIEVVVSKYVIPAVVASTAYACE